MNEGLWRTPTVHSDDEIGGIYMESLLSRVRELKRRDPVESFVAKRMPAFGQPICDSVVIAGNGIGALTFAAALARDPRMEGRVTVVAPPVDESRRLLNGVSLRGLAADFLCTALGVTHEELLDVVAGPGQRPVAHANTAAMAFKKPDGNYGFSTAGSWQGVFDNSLELVWGVRNSRVTGGMVELMQSMGIKWVEEKAHGLEQLKDLAQGSRPLIANATTNSTLLGAGGLKPKIMVLATQAPMIESASGVRAPLGANQAFVPLTKRSGAIDVGYYTPFKDPLSPRSTWYGITARLVAADSGFNKAAELEAMQDELFGVADALGLTPDDPDETLGTALVPASRFGSVPPSATGTLELRRAYSGGAPCFYADGMLSSAVGGVIGARAVLNGQDPDPIIRHALRQVRWVNYLWHIECMKIPGLVDKLMRRSVPGAMAYPHGFGVGWWASRRRAA
ncbi:MAG: hypothetical protein L0H31_14715 [Nocardioidaceae bacterium]|nr:hypothetical protein [Nocardioidaceae bacterium]